ncbi:hypothetical protein RMATCC62417_03649 [Rhizopus microsporus]|nr:hypothetical protein RMATCC62417_03649 [Rhizopus microsporus]
MSLHSSVRLKSRRILQQKAFKAYFSQDGLHADKGETALAHLEKILKDEAHWVAYHADKYLHLGNRSSNKVEGSHASLKIALGTFSGKLALVLHKIDLWAVEKNCTNHDQ